MVSVVACLLAGLVLVAAGVLKLAGGADARAALATYGVRGRAAAPVWFVLSVVEIGLGGAVAAGVDVAARAAAVLMAGACVAQIAAIVAGRAGSPCACFGARGRVGRASAGRAAALAAVYALLPVLPRGHVSTDGWLAIGLGLALAGVIALSVVVLAPAREVGVLRLARSPKGALEIVHEGPEVGALSPLIAEFGELAPGQLALAVFSSQSCGLCRALEPTVAMFGLHASIVLRTFDDVLHAGAWAAADVPGSPYAVALDADGTVLAKGTFNTGAQLETVLAAAERRRGTRQPRSAVLRISPGT